jgi:hypothetical protein
MTVPKENLAAAKEAIQYLNKLKIVSVNVPFRINSYYANKRSRLDCFLFDIMRAECDPATVRRHMGRQLNDEVNELKEGEKLDPKRIIETRHYVKKDIATNRALRGKALEILRSMKTKEEKRMLLKKLMDEINYDGDLGGLGNITITHYRDESRIKSVKAAVKLKHGNCGEKSAIAATYLLEKFKNTKCIFWVESKIWDHAWCILANEMTMSNWQIEGHAYSTWDDSAVVVDGWTGDYYPVKHPYSLIHGASAGNPFQLVIRRKVQQASKHLQVNERLKWPPMFEPSFLLSEAVDKEKKYTKSGYVYEMQKHTNAIADNEEEMEAALDRLENPS